MRIRFHREASEELDAAAAWYEDQEGSLGEDLLAEVDRAVVTIEESPESWPVVRRKTGFRRFLLSRFPYAILYECSDEEIRIFAVSHSKRRPGYWRNRRFQ